MCVFQREQGGAAALLSAQFKGEREDEKKAEEEVENEKRKKRQRGAERPIVIAPSRFVSLSPSLRPSLRSPARSLARTNARVPAAEQSTKGAEALVAKRSDAADGDDASKPTAKGKRRKEKTHLFFFSGPAQNGCPPPFSLVLSPLRHRSRSLLDARAENRRRRAEDGP